MSDLTTKTIRLVIHVFQKDDGTGNLQNTSYDNYWLGLLVSDASDKMGDLDPMKLQTNSPYYQDSKIRYKLMQVYFWQNTSMWSKGDNSAGNYFALRNFVNNQNVNYANTALHVYIPGDYPADDNSVSGIACIGCVGGAQLEDIFHSYNDGGNFWGPAGLLRHEIGHNINLSHSWETNDFCDDTPPNSNCWDSNNGCSNNVMDYNNSQKALTLDQLSRAHVWLNENDQILYSGREVRQLAGDIITVNGTSNLGCCTLPIDHNSATIDITSSNVSSVSWTKTGGSGSFSTSNGGLTLNLSSLGSIYLTATWEENCMTFSKTYVFFYQPSARYSASPNPSSGQITVSSKGGKTYYKIGDKLIEYSPYIQKVEILGVKGHVRKVFNYDGQSLSESIQINTLENGKYYLKVTNQYDSAVLSILKI